MKGLFIPGITENMFRNGCLEGIEALMTEGEMHNINYSNWIPVSERLPEKAGEYLVTSSINLGKKSPVREVHIDYFCKSSRKWLYEGEDVIAWKPLPEAYQEESEAKHD